MNTNKKQTEQLTQDAVMQSVLKPSDLRIGNLILKNNEIYEISSLFFVDLYDGTIRENYNNSYVIEPIKITKEWLLNFGFENKYGSYVLSTLRGTIQIEENLAEISSVITHNGFMSPCEYVHQLQNLYYALTQSELTVA